MTLRKTLGGVYKSYDGSGDKGLANGLEAHSTNKERQLDFEVDYVDMQTPFSADSARNVWLPDGSIVNWVRFEVMEEYAGGTDIQLGLTDSDGSLIQADFFGTIAGVSGKKVGYSEQIPNVAPVTAGDQADAGPEYTILTVTPVGTFTKGKCRVTISYVPPFTSYEKDGLVKRS